MRDDTKIRAFAAAGALTALCAAVPLTAADWPMYARDRQRSNVAEENLALPLRRVWVYRCAQPPHPAWPEPVKTLNRFDFDYAFHPVVAGGLVCFGSSADDTVRALDAKSGEERWHFIAGGPVRFAPQIADGKVYFAADDGVVYCLDAATGKCVWTFDAAPSDERLIGNERMISRWPARSGVLVDGGVLYCTSGMWPADGIFVHALDAASGKTLWRNDTSGLIYDARTLHMGFDFATYGVCPQGALLATDDILLVPAGKALPAAFERRNGRLRYYHIEAEYNTCGGTWVAIDGNKFYTTPYFFSYHTATGLEAGRNFSRNMIPAYETPIPGKAYSHYEKLSAIITGGKPYARMAYGMALAGRILVIGHNGSVSAEPIASNGSNELWRAEIEGEARGLAVADGRLFVSTSDGVIYCFGSGEVVDAASSPRALRGEESGMRKAEGRNQNSEQSEIRNLKSEIAEGGGQTPPAINHQPSTISINHLRSAGIDRGYALVIGDSDGAVSEALATQTRLHVVNALTDASAVAALRERLLAETAWYGSRIHVQRVARLDALPFPQYFANAVIVAANEAGRDKARPSPDGIVTGGPRSVVAGLSGKELYRVLRPCGGILLFPGLKATEADALVKETGASASEISVSLTPITDHLTPITAPAIMRGKLPGALDWDSDYAMDQRVKWPLRLLWFGGPGPALVMDRKQFTDIGPAANGRFFVIGADMLSAVDAYNGALLWTRPIPKFFADLRLADGIHLIADADRIGGKMYGRGLNADGSNVYLTLSGYFNTNETGCVVLDAGAGEQRNIYGPYTAPPMISIATPQTWSLTNYASPAGTERRQTSRPDQRSPENAAPVAVVALQQDAEGLFLTLTTDDPIITPLDRWDLYFDFRPWDARYGLYDRGAFSLAVFPSDGVAPAYWARGNGKVVPEVRVAGVRKGKNTTTTVRLPWTDLIKLAGEKPVSFGFGARLNSCDDPVKERVAQRYLFCDLVADGLNNGWANIVLAANAAAAKPTPSVLAGPYSALPKLPPARRRASGAQPAARAARRHPLTGAVMPKLYQTGGMCGGPAYSAYAIFHRTTALGIYDFADDSGMRAFDGIKPGCATTMTASQGLLLSVEGRGGCVCTFNFQTSLALAPVEKRQNEDWALYFDLDADARIVSAALNFGAPGDRRADDGTLWLGFPRIENGKGIPVLPPNVAAVGVAQRPMPGNLRVPMTVEMFPGGDTYRFNSDSVAFRGSDRPWLYASGYRGIRKATLKLDCGATLVSTATAQPPDLDGRNKDPIWAGQPQAVLAASKTDVFIHHDNEHLYFFAGRPAVIGNKGNVVPWIRDAPLPENRDDQSFYNDCCYEFFFSDADSERVVHLRVMPSGARFDALSESRTAAGENVKWNGRWQHAVEADTNGFAVEMAVPWKTLTDAGLNHDKLAVNIMANGPFRQSEALRFPGMRGRERCENFAPLLRDGQSSVIAPRAYTVRLHFAEPDAGAQPGLRVFDVKLQGQTVLKDMDVAKEAGSARAAVVKEIKGVKAAESLILECVSAVGEITPENAPILCALELAEE